MKLMSFEHSARCTTATPRLFAPAQSWGNECRDGGLVPHNPTQIAFNEVRKIWGPDVTFDAIFSVGSGKGEFPASEPYTSVTIPPFLVPHLSNMMRTVNGDVAFRQFENNHDQLVRDRTLRLSPSLMGVEPAFDGFRDIPTLEAAAMRYDPITRVSGLNFAPNPRAEQVGVMRAMADRLRSSLFFFHLTEVNEHQQDVTVVRGQICCRLDPSERGFKTLMAGTRGFFIRGKYYDTPSLPSDHPFRLDIVLQQQDLDEPIRIDHRFGNRPPVTISGFPTTLRVG